jgi:riboflavin kinase/FMN adenylyltransferase
VFRIYRSLRDIGPEARPCAVTIGNFDGVHVGHRRIFRRVVELGSERGWVPSVLTFEPHPTQVVAPERAPKLLTTPDQRYELMREEGIEQVFALPFDRDFSLLTPLDFVKRVLVDALGARAVLVGENFRFGNLAAGDVKTLRQLGSEYGFSTEVVPSITLRGRMVSSTEVRRLAMEGEISAANRMLGRAFSLEGEVVRGRGIGSKQTVPTLNLSTQAEVLPANGVYITRTFDLESNRSWPSITNVGYRPTFAGDDLTVETFLLAPLKDRAPDRIRIEFLRRVREERKFESPELLKQQILRDVSRAQRYFRASDRFIGRARYN